MDIEREIAGYAGADYAKPKWFQVAELDLFEFQDLDELIEALVVFRSANSANRIEADIDRDDEFSRARFVAYREETPDETAARIASYRRDVLARQADRLELYRSLKQEFEGGA